MQQEPANQNLRAIGWIGAFMLAVCGIPQAYECWLNGNANGLSPLFLGSWFVGEVLTLVFVLYEQARTDANMWPLLFNYAINILTIFVMIYYKLFPIV
ncbi:MULTISPECIES: PQ-loop repeat-containing protein [unclassified Synechocystis]|uniref:PQ-loop repeat-containing protein n=1 Tax=unclassified Synechocystis TaxID=2640012 RepID=UPI00048A774F|nr:MULTISPECIES: PQ-loop repeat-containing protein [unclassified Synechocystis]MCT0252673.1 PQ-loop repeat-containing protein [Synechocystis sp. CS-94]